MPMTPTLAALLNLADMHAPTLAQRGDWVELVIYAIGTVIVVGGWIANQFREMRAEQQRRRKIAELEAGTDKTAGQRPDDAGLHRMPTQDELARRRRQQLAELARRRGEADGPSRAEPANLSPQEATQRQRAREAYERRAETLRRQRDEAEAQAQRQTQEAARRQRELAHRRELAEQAQRQRQLQRQMQGRAQTQPPPSPPPASPAAARPAPPRQLRPTDVAAPGRAPILQATAPTGDDFSGADLGSLDIHALRRAIVLKEILDRPIALRSPADATMF
jgi:hypothetical protein